jgi:type 1 glutamine amidotransferase
MRWGFLLPGVCTGFVLTASVSKAQEVPVMILDGESAGAYHDWQRTTALLREVLDSTGLFTVDVVTAPASSGELTGFAPQFHRYAAVVLNYDAPDGRWPAALKASFEDYVRNGGGVALVHAANNAFPGWSAFNQIAGVGGWRDRNADAGPYWYLRDGQLVADDSPGPTGTHGRREPYLVSRRAEHSITRGLPETWMHAGDELYAHLRGPGVNMTVLASAYSDPGNGGSGRDEPQLMVLQFGEGRVFHTTFGHDRAAMRSVDFIVTLQRGVEWAATGRVTQPLPGDFPGDAVRVRSALEASRIN